MAKVRPVGPDGFYSDEPGQKNIKRKKPATKRKSAGTGALAKRRKKVIDDNIRKGGG